ncbi:MAG: LuxR C-terminal-related transcriptional regulator [Chloroflexi bacterium]|nr:LuxR C-terminal-related transcriptional regulator [Chloroflexota bacterium]
MPEGESEPGSVDRAGNLSDREREILHHLAGGSPTSEIAATLHITESLLRSHVRKITRKLRLQSLSQATIYAVKNKL